MNLIKKLLPVVFGLMISSFGYTQKNFGSQYLSWVKNESAYFSKNIALQNYDLNLHNFHQIVYAESFVMLYETDNLLSILEDSIYSQAIFLDSISDDLERNYLRGIFASQNQNLVFLVESKLNILDAKLGSIDSVGTQKTFYQNGLYNYGGAHVVASFLQIGDGLSSYMPEKYNYSIQFQYSSDPDNPGSVSSGGKYAYYGSIGGMVIGGIVGGIYGGPGGVKAGMLIGGFVGGIIGSGVDWLTGRNEEEEAQKEHERQLRKVEEGNKLLPEKMLSPETQFTLYDSINKRYMNEFHPVRASLDSQLVMLKGYFHEVSMINLINKRISKSFLAQERLDALKERYEADRYTNEIQGYSDAIRFLQTVSIDLSYLREKSNKLSSSSDLHSVEGLLESIETSKRILTYAVDSDRYPLINKELNQFIKRYLEEEALVRSYIYEGAKEENYFANLTSEIKFTNNRHFQKSVVPREEVLLADYTQSFKMLQGKSVQNQNVPMIGYSNGMYLSITYDMGNSYEHNRLINGGEDPFRDVLASSYDGGISAFNVQASNDISSASRDMEIRISRLDKEHKEFTPASTEWQQKTIEMNTTPIVLQDEVDVVINNREKLIAENRDVMDSYRDEVDDLLSGNTAELTYISRQRRLDLISDFTTDWGTTIASGVQTPLLRGYGNSISNYDFITSNIGKDIQNAESLVNEGKHKTIGSKEEYDQLIKETEQLATYVENLRIQGHPKEVIDHYLDELNDNRLYFKGYPTSTAVSNRAIGKMQNQDALFNSEIEEWSNCVSKYGARSCDIQHDYFVRHITGNSAVGEILYMGNDDNPTTLLNAGIQSSSGNNVYIYAPADSTGRRYSILIPGYYPTSADARVVYIDLDNPQNSKFNVSLKSIYGDNGSYLIYQQTTSSYYGNHEVKDFNSSSESNQCYDIEVGYYDCSGISANIGLTDKYGKNITVKDDISLGSTYVTDIHNRYGANANIFYEDIHDHLDLYFSISTLPIAKQTPEYRGMINDIKAFDQSYDVLVDPRNLYKSQAMHTLVNMTHEALNQTDDLSEIDAIIKEAAKYKDLLIDLGTTVTPGVNDARDMYELLTGVDLITGENIGVLGRVLAGGGLLVGSGALFRNILKSTTGDITTRILKRADALKGFPGMKYVRSGSFKGSMISESGVIYAKSRKYKDGVQHSFFHIVSKHTLWGRRRLLKLTRRTKRSMFEVTDPKYVTKIIDDGVDILKTNDPTKVFVGKVSDASREYFIKMDKPIGYTKKNEPMYYLRMLFDKESQYNAIRTAHPVLKPIINN